MYLSRIHFFRSFPLFNFSMAMTNGSLAIFGLVLPSHTIYSTNTYDVALMFFSITLLRLLWLHYPCLTTQ